MINCRGMTLIELVIVLALLAGLAGMALTSVGQMSMRARQDETIRRLDAIKFAVCGDGSEVGRFYRDMRRLPMVHSTIAGEELLELWSLKNNDGTINLSSALKYGSVSCTDSWPSDWTNSSIIGFVPGDVSMSFGWNGPYIDLGANKKLYDGFGNNLLITENSEATEQASDWLGSNGSVDPLSVGDTIAGVFSCGSNNSFTESTDDETNLSVLFSKPNVTLSVTIKVKDGSATPEVWKTPLATEPVDPAITWTADGIETNAQDYVLYVDGTDKYVFQSLNSNTLTGGTSSLSYINSEGISKSPEALWDSGCNYRIGDVITETVTGSSSTSTIYWKYCGTLTEYKLNMGYIANLRVALFMPVVDTDTNSKELKCITYEDNGTITATASIDGTNEIPLTPGECKVYAYGYIANGDSTYLRSSEKPETIELKPGNNHITLYLNKNN